MRSLHVHLSHRDVFDDIANQKAEQAEAKNDKEYILFKRLNPQIKQPADPITNGANRSGPQESGDNTIKKIL